MAAPFLTDIELNNNQLFRARLHNLGADPTPTSSQGGLAEFRTDTKVAKVWNGLAFDQMSGTVVSVAGTTASGTVQGVVVGSAATAAGRSDQTVTISTTAATGAQAGSMAAADFTKLANATATNTASTIVMRDGSGNFAAGVITASLTGTASNATNLNSQPGTYYLDRTNHTGTQLASTISNFDTQVRTSRLDQMAAPTGAVAFNGQRATGLADPTNAQDAATKAYADSLASGLDVKASVRWASTANLALTGLVAVDGATVVSAGDRVLAKNQTDATQNGIYVAAAGPWVRAADADSTAEVSPGMFTFVEEGTAQADTGWVLTTNGVITVGTTTLAFAQFSGAGSYAAGNGLLLTGTSFSVRAGSTGSIAVSATGVDVASTYAGGLSIVTVGTIGTGTWQGTPVNIAYGGTGATNPAQARANLGVPGSAPIANNTITGDGVKTSFTFTHNLGTALHSLQMVDSSGNVTYADFKLGINADTIVTSQPLANGAVYTLTAIG